jgi:hypothetical protein
MFWKLDPCSYSGEGRETNALLGPLEWVNLSHWITHFKFQVILRPTDIRPVHLAVGPHLGPTIRFLLLSDICGLHIVGHPLWREDGSVIYSYNSLSLSGLSTSELMTTSYCFVWGSLNLKGQVPVITSPRNRVAQIHPRALNSTFRRLLRLAWLQWSCSNPPTHRSYPFHSSSSIYIATYGQSASVGPHDQNLIFFIWQLLSCFFM